MSDAPPVALADRVTKRFGNAELALSEVSIRVGHGTITGLVGPDGAGKTTLIHLLAGLMKADSGRVELLGGPPDAARSELGYMPQRFGLYEDLSVLENLNLYAELRGLPMSQRSETFDRLLGFTDLKRFQTRLAGKLSGGMKQKLGLACALVRTPKVLLLDEPGVGVDPISRRELWAMVSDLKHEGIGVLWSTAYLDEAANCDCVYLLNNGKLLFSGPPADLTGRVAGRVFRISQAKESPRQMLGEALDSPEIMDGVIQGQTIRILLKPGADVRSATEFAGPEARSAPTEPRFEEGFVDILGGSIGGSSALAERYRTIPENEGAVIEAKGLTKRFGDFTAAENIRFDVGRGRIFGLLGPNGAGKSTTFKMLCGLLTPSGGTGSVAGYDLRKSRADARGALGYMAQKFSLYGDLSVRQNLDFFAGAYGLDRAAARRAIEALVDVFALETRLETDAGALPLGFKQRLALACAVLHEPPALFLDEPTSGVDPVMRREFWSHINGLVGKGVTVLVTTHFMDEAEYCDEVTLIYRAVQIATGTPDALKKRAAALSNQTDPTMEDAFIALIEEHDRTARREEAA